MVRAFRLEIAGINGAPQFNDHSAAVISTIWFSCAFMEAAINELFETAATDPFEYFSELDEPGKLSLSDARILSVSWKRGKGEQLRVLDKYLLALDLLEKPSLDTGASPFQDAAVLVEFRNALTHYKPVWRSSDDPYHLKPASSFRGRFELHPNAQQEKLSFPLVFLSADCAHWSLKTAAALVHSFFKNLGMSYHGLEPLQFVSDGLKEVKKKMDHRSS